MRRVSRGSGAPAAAGAGSGKKGWEEARPPCWAEATHCAKAKAPSPAGTAALQGQTALYSHPAMVEQAHGPARRQGGTAASAGLEAGPPEWKNPENAAYCFRKERKYSRSQTGTKAPSCQVAGVVGGGLRGHSGVDGAASWPGLDPGSATGQTHMGQTHMEPLSFCKTETTTTPPGCRDGSGRPQMPCVWTAHGK